MFPSGQAQGFLDAYNSFSLGHRVSYSGVSYSLLSQAFSPPFLGGGSPLYLNLCELNGEEYSKIVFDLHVDGTSPLCLKRGTILGCDCPLHCRMFDIPGSTELNCNRSLPPQYNNGNFPRSLKSLNPFANVTFFSSVISFDNLCY